MSELRILELARSEAADTPFEFRRVPAPYSSITSERGEQDKHTNMGKLLGQMCYSTGNAGKS